MWLSAVSKKTTETRSYYPVLVAATAHIRLVHVTKGPPSEPPLFASLPKGTVNYATGLLYLFDDDIGCVITVHMWARMDLWERSFRNQMDIVIDSLERIRLKLEAPSSTSLALSCSVLPPVSSSLWSVILTTWGSRDAETLSRIE